MFNAKVTAQESDSLQVSGAAACSLWNPISLQTILSKYHQLTEWSWRSSLVMLVYWNNLSCQSCEPVWTVSCPILTWWIDVGAPAQILTWQMWWQGKKSLNESEMRDDSFLETTRGLIPSFIHAALDVAVIRWCFDFQKSKTLLFWKTKLRPPWPHFNISCITWCGNAHTVSQTLSQFHVTHWFKGFKYFGSGRNKGHNNKNCTGGRCRGAADSRFDWYVLLHALYYSLHCKK